MFKKLLVLGLIFLSFVCLVSCNLNQEVTQTDTTKWNVMIYMCGSSLEGLTGYASYNLNEIAKTVPNGNVNLYIMTGGVDTITTHTDSNGRTYHYSWKNNVTAYESSVKEMDLSGSVNGSFQYWKYELDEDTNKGVFKDVTPSTKGMSEPAYLENFINFATASSPNRKNLLCLWDHGSGLYGGLIQDEESTMTLAELGLALKNSGVHFDAVLMDLCIMQTLETALCLYESADYMIGSQDNISGLGTDYTAWIGYLFTNPACSARDLGKTICDSQAQKTLSSLFGTTYYADLSTFSVIDLSAVKNLALTMDCLYYYALENVYYDDVSSMKDFLSVLDTLTPFGTKPKCGYDIKQAAKAFLDADIISTDEYNAICTALDMAVSYNRTGTQQPNANGLSFSLSFADSVNTDDLTSYLKNFCSFTPNYKALYDLYYDLSLFDTLHLEYSSNTDTGIFKNYYMTSFEGMVTVPYQKRALIKDIEVWYLLRDRQLDAPSLFFGAKYFTNAGTSPSFQAYSFQRAEMTYLMPAMAIEYYTSGTDTTVTNLPCTFLNGERLEDSYGKYERYIVKGLVYYPLPAFYEEAPDFIVLKDWKTGTYEVYLADTSVNTYSTDRYKYCSYSLEDYISLLQMSYPSYMLSFGVYNSDGAYAFKDFTQGIKISDIVASEVLETDARIMPLSLNYYKTYRYIITDIFGNTYVIHSDIDMDTFRLPT